MVPVSGDQSESFQQENVLQKLLEAVQLLFCTKSEVIEQMIVRSDDSRTIKSESSAALKALTALVRSDYSFSDYGTGPSFHNLSLQMAPISAEVAVSK